MNARSRAARERASEIIALAGVKSLPVPIDQIIRSHGIVLRYAPLDDELSGMAFVSEGQKMIAVNALHHPNRQRFTAAHEFGHHVLHAPHLRSSVHVDKGILRRDAVSARGTDAMEIDANTFASELLMPSAFIDKLVAQGFDVADEVGLSEIARRFKVSPAALQYRILSSNI